MDWIIVLGYGFALLIGAIMGLLGSGGSLVLPLLVYLFAKDATTASGYALFLVGLTATVGVISKFRRREVNISLAIGFILPVSLGTYLARDWLVRAIPESLFTVGSFTLTRDAILMTLYAGMLLLSFSSMMGWWGQNLATEKNMRKERPWAYFSLLAVLGTLIGILSGLIGAGGGILIVPVLVILMGLPMKITVGTSLAIIAFKNYIGFGVEWMHLGNQVEWQLLLSLSAIMVLGILGGSFAAIFISGKKLKQGFAWFIMAMAIFIITKEFILP